MKDKVAKRRCGDTTPNTLHYGDDHWTRLKPERLASGNRHGSITKPDKVVRGESQGLSKLTNAKVTNIKQQLRNGIGGSALARIYGVSPSAISAIAHNKTWTHIK